MEQTQLQRAIEAILFAAGERIETVRLAAVLETDEADIVASADALAGVLAYERRGIRILKLEDGYQMVSSGVHCISSFQNPSGSNLSLDNDCSDGITTG